MGGAFWGNKFQPPAGQVAAVGREFYCLLARHQLPDKQWDAPQVTDVVRPGYSVDSTPHRKVVYKYIHHRGGGYLFQKSFGQSKIRLAVE